MRFELLLLACLVLTLLLIALLEVNVYDGWRQMYFLYAPLCLRAVAGLRAVTTALPSRWPWGDGLAGLGLGAIAIASMAIHPHQFDYFNFLVDRATPEHAGSQYELDYWRLASRKALDDLRTRYAGSFHINEQSMSNPKTAYGARYTATGTSCLRRTGNGSCWTSGRRISTFRCDRDGSGCPCMPRSLPAKYTITSCTM